MFSPDYEGGGCVFQRHFFPRGFFGNASVYLSAIHFHNFWCKNLEKIVLPRESVANFSDGYNPNPRITMPILRRYHPRPKSIFALDIE